MEENISFIKRLEQYFEINLTRLYNLSDRDIMFTLVQDLNRLILDLEAKECYGGNMKETHSDIVNEIREKYPHIPDLYQIYGGESE